MKLTVGFLIVKQIGNNVSDTVKTISTTDFINIQIATIFMADEPK